MIKIPFICEVISYKFNPNNVVETPLKVFKQFEVTEGNMFKNNVKMKNIKIFTLFQSF